MLISVVIPAFDDEATVAAAVQSALDQRVAAGDEVEVVVVDDGSSDDTATAAAGSGDPRVRVVRQDNAGPGAARNRGASEATGEVLVFLDADDLLLDGALASFAAARRRGDEASAALVRGGATTRLPDGTEHTMMSWPDPHPYPRGVPFTGTFAIDRALFARIGGYDTAFEFGENSELLLRAQLDLAERGEEPAFVDSPTVLYLKQPDGRHDAYRDRIIAANRRMFALHGDTLRDDPEMLANHLAVATNHLRLAGLRREAIGAALRVVRLRPLDWRSWARLVLCLSPRRAER